jgi:hypothetical protein
MWPVIRRTSVPPTEMSKDHRPPPSPTGGVARPVTPPVGVPQTRTGSPKPTGHNFTAWTYSAPHPVECRAGGTVVA